MPDTPRMKARRQVLRLLLLWLASVLVQQALELIYLWQLNDLSTTAENPVASLIAYIATYTLLIVGVTALFVYLLWMGYRWVAFPALVAGIWQLCRDAQSVVTTLLSAGQDPLGALYGIAIVAEEVIQSGVMIWILSSVVYKLFAKEQRTGTK